MEQKLNLRELFLNLEGGYIPVPRKIIRVLGFNATGFLEELYDRYNYYIENNLLNNHGEFFYTISDVEINIGLSRKEQETAIKKLKEYDFIKDVKLRGIPRKRYFKLNDNINEILKRISIESDIIQSEILEKSLIDIKRCSQMP